MPSVGTAFDELGTAIRFYKRYAELSGFMIRLDTSRKKGGVVVDKKCVCNKAGESKPTGKERRVAITRVGCKASIRFRRVEEMVGEEKVVKYVVYTFQEGHTHPLNTPSTMVHLKQSRELNSVHKRMILGNARANYGAVRTYKMFKEQVCGYRNVGASKVDFKNFYRDVKKFFKEYDAQMIIETFIERKAMCSSFYFDFDVDEDGALTRLFWADPIAIKNFILFGDPLSFDTTFNKNDYRMVFAPFTGMDNHKKCVSFGAGLIAKETTESFVWLFETFMTAMGGRYPRFIITDQDAGIKAAVKKVFGDKTEHKFCIWHILSKATVRIPQSILKDTENTGKHFLKDLNACVWGDDIGPLEFETEWAALVASYKLEGHEWMDNIYEMRESWVPAYSRDIPLRGLMRTTSRSESENSFFAKFTNPRLTLGEFSLRFDSAMDAQRWNHSKLVAESKNSSPRLLTPLALEEHASKFYTPVIFYEFQEEIEAACFRCGTKGKTTEGALETVVVVDHDIQREYVVEVDENHPREQVKVVCSCKKFVREGILCRHSLCVLKDKGFTQVPQDYLLNRWWKNATCRPLFTGEGTLLEDCRTLENKNNTTSELWSEVLACVSLVEANDEKSDDLLKILREFRESIPQAGYETRNVKSKNNKAEIEALLGMKVPTEVTVLPPKQCKNKGTGRSGKRFISEKEKAARQQKKPKRKCNHCGEMSYHDLRNCPMKKKRVNSFTLYIDLHFITLYVFLSS